MTTEEIPVLAQFGLTGEQAEIRALARKIAQDRFKPRSLEWEETGKFPWENMEILAKAGLLGASVPEEYGGAGGTWLDAALILEQLGSACYVTAMAALGELGVQIRAIAAYGTEEQKRRFLPDVAAGKRICAVSMTEADAGSDIWAMRTKAVVDGDDVVVNGGKVLCSRADVAGLFIVYVRWSDDPGTRPIGAVLIERGTPGFTISPGRKTLGGEDLYDLTFENCRIPSSNVLVREDGFRRMLTAFNGQRCLNASISVGIAQGAQDAAVEYVKTRSQGGGLLGDHQGIRWMLADNEVEIQAARQLVWRAAANAAQAFPSRHEAAVAKVNANEMALRVTDRVLQIFGGNGWVKEMPAERYLRWARYGPLGGGTPQIQRNAIARELLK
ncbi:acyl-CoA dehydrogenase family protein [Amycolatopsis jejuensis]|uniref:acyl-CoA dehydrogenase family protein n=1 Tax=Amycolatopsis jejuensis TaxID=330084 RepID=UPI00052710F6|nr:acyl-CoA dehydrogenase family protein [Amycolatopsis jejuensis]